MKNTKEPEKYLATLVFKGRTVEIGGGPYLTFDEEPTLLTVLEQYKTLLETKPDEKEE